MWPPPAQQELSDALKAEVPLAPELDYWTSPEVTVSLVQNAVCCAGSVVVLLDGCSGFLKQSKLALWRPASPGLLRPLLLSAFPEAPAGVSRLWPGDSCFFAQCGSDVWRVELEASAASEDGSGDSPARASAARVFSGEGAGSIASMCCSVGAAGGLFCAMLVKPPPQADPGFLVLAPRQSLQQTPPGKLSVFEPSRGLRAVADVPRLSEQLAVSGGPRRVCVWRAMLNEVPEEAERGEFLALCLDSDAGDQSGGSRGKSQAICLTEGAGRVGWAAVSDDGQLLLLQANFSAERPVTKHMMLVLLRWPKGEPRPLPERRTLIEDQHVLSFNFLPNAGAAAESAFYVTVLAGVDAETSLWKVQRADSAEDTFADKSAAVPSARLPTPVLSSSAAYVPGGQGSAGLLAFGSEAADALPFLAAVPLAEGPSCGDPRPPLKLPQPVGSDLLRVEKVIYTHRGDQVTGLLLERSEPPLPADAPLLVHVHGGPAVGVLCTQRMAVDATRYPYRQFLVAGYRVFQPMYRGTLGFGDRWSQGNIGSQGYLDADLGDILAGVKWLNSDHPRLRGTVEPARTGIFGGSYGGYMTIRAMSQVPDFFGAAVALYGFVHNRWMTYEGGDFTWEDEYIAVPEDGDFQIQMVEFEEDPAATAARAPAEAKEAASPKGDASPAQDSTTRSRAPSNSSQMSASDVWPLPKAMEASDSFNGLHRIRRPMLLIHGEKDDICPLSQSQVAFHMLEKQGIPTGLVVYPGEGHGFTKPLHRQDRDRRMLAWFAEHLQGSRGPVPEAFHAKL